MRPRVSVALGAVLLVATACAADEPDLTAADVEVCDVTVRVLTDYASAVDDGPRTRAAYDVWDPARDDVAAVADDVGLDSLRPAVEDVVALPDTGFGAGAEIPTDVWLRLSEACNGEELP